MIAVALSPSASWLAIGLGLFVLWQIVKRLPWEEVSDEPSEPQSSWTENQEAVAGIASGARQNANLATIRPAGGSSLTSLRAGERGQAGAPFDWDTAA